MKVSGAEIPAQVRADEDGDQVAFDKKVIQWSMQSRFCC